MLRAILQTSRRLIFFAQAERRLTQALKIGQDTRPVHIPIEKQFEHLRNDPKYAQIIIEMQQRAAKITERAKEVSISAKDIAKTIDIAHESEKNSIY